MALRSAPRLQTVEQAEERGYWVLMVAGVLVAIGLVCTVTLVFAFVGVPLLVIGTLIAVGDLVWMLRIARRPVREIPCRDCEKVNRAFLDTGPLRCSDCGTVLGEPSDQDAVPPAAAA